MVCMRFEVDTVSFGDGFLVTTVAGTTKQLATEARQGGGSSNRVSYYYYYYYYFDCWSRLTFGGSANTF